MLFSLKNTIQLCVSPTTASVRTLILKSVFFLTVVKKTAFSKRRFSYIVDLNTRFGVLI